MGKLKSLCCLCFTLFALSTNAQVEQVLNIEFARKISGNFSKFYVDNQDNIFVLMNNNIQIKKLSPQGDSLQIFDNVAQYGNIYSMDVSNALKLLVYYRDFSTILVLDRFLNAVNTIDLRQNNIFQSRAAASSYDGQIWTYDELSAQIKKINQQGNVTFTSTDLRTVFDDAPVPHEIFDNNGLLYLYDSNQGWLLFDYYGAFKQKIACENWEDISVMNNILFGRTGDTLWMCNPKKLIVQSFKTSMDIDFRSIKHLLFANGKLFVLNADGIEIYNVKQ